MLDILDNAPLAKSFVVGFDLDRFRAETFYAVVRCLEIISEASRRLDDDLKARRSHLDWRAISGSGNIYRHNHDNVAPDFVWRTATEHMDALIDMAEMELCQSL